MNTIRKGDAGDDVRQAQRLINIALALDPPLTEDGIFGPRTEEAVYAYQASNIGPDGRPLMVDGVIGPVTWWALTEHDQTQANEFDTGRVIVTDEPRCELAREVLNILREEIIAGAREVGDDNLGPFVEKYAGREGVPWCAWGASWVYTEAAERTGIDTFVEPEGGARALLRQFEGANLMYLPGERNPSPGDLVAWWRVAADSWQGHCEIVTAYRSGTLYTVGFNRGGYPAPVRQFSYVVEREQRMLGFGELCE